MDRIEFFAFVNDSFVSGDVDSVLAACREAKVAKDRFLTGYAVAAYRTLTLGVEAPDAPVAAPVPTVVKGAQSLYNGYYTVVSELGNLTFKVRDDEWTWMSSKPAAGTRWIGFLTGSENENDSNYKGCGFVRPDGTVSVWSKFRNDGRIVAAINILLGNVSEAGKNYALETLRCSRCNRLLSREDSILAAQVDGLGPDCRNAVMGG
jgi:hypothetical protein